MKVAAIDVGTNTALLLIAEEGPSGALVPLHAEQRFIRLGEGVDARRCIGAPALGRLREALLAYRSVAEAWAVSAVVVGATSASRDAVNREAVVDFVRRETGLVYEVLSGEEEAYWSFAGALAALDGLAGACAVIDIGGGSTELVVGKAGPVVTYRRSLNVGSVRLTERFFSRQPPRSDEVATAEALVARLYRKAAVPAREAPPLVGAAGTATSLALVHHGAADWAAFEGAACTLAYADVRRWRHRLLAASFDEVMALNPAVMTGRADVFPAGVLILETVMREAGWRRCRVSPGGLRHGLALRALQGFRRKDAPPAGLAS